MLIYNSLCILAFIGIVSAVFHQYPASLASNEEKPSKDPTTNTSDQYYDSGHETETEFEEKDKILLKDALNTVIANKSNIAAKNNNEHSKLVDIIDKENVTMERFMEEMDNISLGICQSARKAVWSYISDPTDVAKKTNMDQLLTQEDETRKKYWGELKKNYIEDHDIDEVDDPKLSRKLYIVKSKGINVLTNDNRANEDINEMEQVWNKVTLCRYNLTPCNETDALLTVPEIIHAVQASNDSQELLYYWEEYHNAVGPKIRPIYIKYVDDMNKIAKNENFVDAAEMTRFMYYDIHYLNTTNKLWAEVKPLYKLLHDYVKNKLSDIYLEPQLEGFHIPPHLLGEPWIQEWRYLFPKVVPFPKLEKPHMTENTSTEDLFDVVDEFHVSLGFDSNKDVYDGIEITNATDCIASSHDMCDGVHYRVNWCPENISNIDIALAQAAKLSTHVQYFKQYQKLPWIFRSGPNLPFQEAIADMIALQLVSPNYQKAFNVPEVELPLSPELILNHLIWIALEKFPMMGFAYVLDTWRWDVFSEVVEEDEWNKHWWELRKSETGVAPPAPRNETFMDAASKDNLVSSTQFSSYIISTVLEFQIMDALCKQANHTGPLHECSLYGNKGAGKALRKGMSLGASEDWRIVLKTITGQTEISSEALLKYFAPLHGFLKNETNKPLPFRRGARNGPIIVGTAVVILTTILLTYYVITKFSLCGKCLTVVGIRKNGSLDIASSDQYINKKSRMDGGIAEAKF